MRLIQLANLVSDRSFKTLNSFRRVIGLLNVMDDFLWPVPVQN
jgi:hypothetical protein